jgi:RNA polymerase sigma-70 factor, ECF subfamily
VGSLVAAGLWVRLAAMKLWLRLAATGPKANAPLGGKWRYSRTNGLAVHTSARRPMPLLNPQSLPTHTDRLYRAAWALCGSPHDAEDLVQETFARVLARPRFLRGQDELAYLMRTLRNTFLIQRRTASRRPQVVAATIEQVEPVDHRSAYRPEEAAQAREVLATIGTLSQDHRLALVAVDVVGLSYREAANALGTREETIAVRLFRARERMARALNHMQTQPEPERVRSQRASVASRAPRTFTQVTDEA